MNGTAGNDTLLGTATDDLISGLGGNDSIDGLAGSDTLNGNDGNDTLNGGSGNDTLRGGTGINYIDGGSGVDLVILNYSNLGGSIEHDGYANNYGSTYSNDTEQDIHVHENVEKVNLFATNFDDTVSASGINDTLNGGLGNDQLYLGFFNQTNNLNVEVDFSVTDNQVSGIEEMLVKKFESVGGIATGSGDDTISLNSTNANFGWIDGGDGMDSLDVDFSTLTQGINYLDVFDIESIDITGTDFDDTLKGVNLADTINGAAGNDWLDFDLSGETNNLEVKIQLNQATNQIVVNSTPLAISNFEKSNITGGEGEDNIILNYSNLSGGIALDTFTLENNGDVYTLADVYSYETDQYIHHHQDLENINITGTNSSDTLIGGIGTDTIKGNVGNDVITGEGGNDTLNGGEGVDRLVETANVNFTLTDPQLTGNGIDTLYNFEQARIEGGVGNNRLDAGTVTNLNVTLLGADGNDSLYGGAKSDRLFGNAGNDRLESRQGWDSLHGGDGNDALFAGDGNDTLFGGDGNDTLKGEVGNDTINGGAGIDLLSESNNSNLTLTDTQLTGRGLDTISNIELARIEGGVGNNRLHAGTVTDLNVTLLGASGNDSLYGGAKSDRLFGNAGNDRLESRQGWDSLHGGDGNDALFAGDGNDTLFGGDGNDTLKGEAGNDTINGAAGIDLLSESNNSNLTLTDTQLTGRGIDTLSNIELARIEGGVGNNRLHAGTVNDLNVTLLGASGNDSLYGGAKSDQLFGNAGNDRLESRKGWDSLHGGDGNDALFAGDGNDTLFGGDGNDTLKGEVGNDTINGAAGIDLLSESNNSNLTLTDTQLTGRGIDTLSNIELARIEGGVGNNRLHAGTVTNLNVTLLGASGNDSLYGGAKSDRLFGNAGNDRLESRQGWDSLHGGDGNDALFAGDGNDTLFGGDGNDTLKGEVGNDTINGGAGIDLLSESNNSNLTLTDTQLTGRGIDTLSNIELARIEGGVGNNRLHAGTVTNLNVTLLGASGNDSLYGGAKSDQLFGNGGNDRLESRQGWDSLQGAAGNDSLFAGDGNDTLNGGDGDDLLKGEGGNDILNGGAGSDIFVLESVYGTDVINDFSDGIDSFKLSSSLGFSDLSISDNASQTATLIRDDNNQLLATINNISANDITSDDFMSV